MTFRQINPQPIQQEGTFLYKLNNPREKYGNNLWSCKVEPNNGHPMEHALQAANLFVASEELLECLKECVKDSQELLDNYIQKYGENFRPHRLEYMREVVAKARAAIARAERKST